MLLGGYHFRLDSCAAMILRMASQVKILFVCHGNTCRSPMAEALARDIAGRAGRCDLSFVSAGIAPRSTGGAADPRAVVCIGNRGIDLSGHTVRALDAEADARDFDLLLALDEAVLGNVRGRVAARYLHKVRPLMSYAPGTGTSEVPDPYEGSASDYDHALGLIQFAVEGLLAADLKPASPRTDVP